MNQAFALFLLSHQTGIMEHDGTTIIELVNAAHSYRKTNIEIANTNASKDVDVEVVADFDLDLGYINPPDINIGDILNHSTDEID